MACVVPFFGKEIGTDTAVPLSSVNYFISVALTCVLLEIWVVIHVRHGLGFLQDICEHLREAYHGKFSGFLALLSVLFSMLGRFDTFSDIVFTVMLFKDAERTGAEITWVSVRGHVLNFRVPLKHISLFAVAGGVFLCQALPGMVLLASALWLPAAFKLNEFNLLLAVSELELGEEGQE